MERYFNGLEFVFVLIFFLVIIFQLYKQRTSKLNKNAIIANRFNRYTVKRCRLKNDFKIKYFCADELLFKFLTIKAGAIIAREGKYCILRINEEVPPKIGEKYGTRSGDRLVLKIPEKYLEDTYTGYGDFAKFEILNA